MQKVDVDGLCGMYEWQEKCKWCFSREHEEGGIILKCVLKKWDEMALTEFIVLG